MKSTKFDGVIIRFNEFGSNPRLAEGKGSINLIGDNLYVGYDEFGHNPKVRKKEHSIPIRRPFFISKNVVVQDDGYNNPKLRKKTQKEWVSDMTDILEKEIFDYREKLKAKFCRDCPKEDGMKLWLEIGKEQKDILDFNEYYYEANPTIVKEMLEKKDAKESCCIFGRMEIVDPDYWTIIFDFKEDMLLNNKQKEWMSFIYKINKQMLRVYEEYKKFIEEFKKGDEREEDVKTMIEKLNGNIIQMENWEYYEGRKDWVQPFAMKIPKDKIDNFLKKKTLEELLEHIANGNVLDDNEKEALKKFFNTKTGVNYINDLKKKSKYKCKMRTRKCKRDRDEGLSFVNERLPKLREYLPDLEVEVGGRRTRRKKRTRKRRKSRHKSRKKRRRKKRTKRRR